MNIKKCIIGRVQGSYIPAKCYAKVKMMTVSDSKRDEIVKLIGQYIDSYQIQNADVLSLT